MAGHNALARRIGWTEDDIAALDDGADYNHFEDPLAAALAYAERMTRDARTVTDELFARMKSHYTAAQILEITCVVSIANYFNRFTTALRVDPSGSNRPPDATRPASQ